MDEAVTCLAISNFLRQHDLVQVQWVFLSSVSGAPQRDSPDLIRVCPPCKSALPLPPSLPLIAAGFSCGCFVQSRLLPRSQPQQLVLVGPAVSRFQLAELPTDLQQQTLVIHGEADDVVPLDAVMDWARPQGLPVTVFPGTGHFFHGRLTELKAVVKRNCRL